MWVWGELRSGKGSGPEAFGNSSRYSQLNDLKNIVRLANILFKTLSYEIVLV